ncbi:uncharacterized protein LOC129582426 [Paramacrobiotus metropolitanus]|uniref:uncharacterized protein LOC129582426 n=1 Tax=Paramacrobiotus metropolitanus TaxID=2943436 RepID=UPI00244600CA|nr:uncharacterized protein LOC129582426 [Paramacrobiotus metropolitanus]
MRVILVVVACIGVYMISLVVIGPDATDLNDTTALINLSNPLLPNWRNPLCALHLTRGQPCQHCSMDNLHRNFDNQLTETLSNKSIALVGDSRIRYMFAYMRSMLDGRQVILKKSRENFNDTLHRDAQRNIQLAYYIRRYPDEAMRALLHEWRNATDANRIPHYVIMETGAWTVYFRGDAFVSEFRRNLTVVAKDCSALRNRTTIIWIRTLPMHDERLRVDPKWTHRRNGVALTEQLGLLVAEVAREAGIVLWDAVYADSREHIQLYDDILHPGLALRRKAACQLLYALDPRHCQCSSFAPLAF